jgi:hypothetical protein
MSACQGDGTCMTQVTLTRYSNNSCPNNCQLVECHNFKMCGQKRPKNILDCHRGMCFDCKLAYGKVKFLAEKDDCPICFNNNDIVEIMCGHKVCLVCWKKWSDKSEAPVTCPMCRKNIWPWK